MLDQSEVVGYLLRRGLVPPSSVVDGSIVVRDASSRNRNFAVEASEGASYLLKQGLGREGVATVAHEAAVYQKLRRAGPAVTRYLPRFHGYDEDERVLVLELVRGARDLRSHQLRSGRFSTALAGAIGDALGSLHRETAAEVSSDQSGTFPWVMWIHRPDLSIFRDASAAGLELIKIVQSAPNFGSHLDELRASWQPSALIHQDVKWDNFLAHAAPASNRLTLLKVIDWEAACPGDPCWDIGSVFGHYLSLWLFSIPITGREPPERFPELARYPLNRMKPALSACWKAYRKRLGLEEKTSTEWLLRAVSFAGARLIVTAFEAAQMSTYLDSSLMLHLQLALNILDRPREAAVHLLGLPVRAA